MTQLVVTEKTIEKLDNLILEREIAGKEKFLGAKAYRGETDELKHQREILKSMLEVKAAEDASKAKFQPKAVKKEEKAA